MIFDKDDNAMREILLEMPQRIVPTGDDIVKEILDAPYEELMNNLKNEGTFNNLNIRIFDAGNKSIGFVFLNDTEVVSVYVCRDSFATKGFQTLKSWRNLKYPGIFYKLFISFILPKLKIIESDAQLSDMGKNFWVRLIDNNPKLNFYVKGSSGIIQIKDSKLLDKYFGDAIINRNYTFIVTL